MRPSVQDLRDFYFSDPLGRTARVAIRNQVREIWPEAKGQTMAGFGFALPLLSPYLADARRVIALMPGAQGAMAWPREGGNAAVLCEETIWPLDTGRVDKLVVMHGLEISERVSALLDECWRVLGPGGQALFIVPNRASLWARSDRTPFGFGTPYTLGQLDVLLRRHNFRVLRHGAALFQPPSRRRFWHRLGALIGRTGRYLPAWLAGGVVYVLVTKHVRTPAGTSERVTNPLPIGGLAGIAKPALPMTEMRYGALPGWNAGDRISNQSGESGASVAAYANSCRIRKMAGPPI